MSLARRRFLSLASAALGLAACRPRAATHAPAPGPAGATPASPDPPLRSGPILLGGQAQKILILGGTAFLGPQLVEAAQRRGHSVTLFNRGKTRPELFPDVEKLRGDRNSDLTALHGRTWDAVIDTSGYLPRVARASAELLAPNVRQYVFVSTISVYADTSQIGIGEDAPLATAPDPTTEDIATHYGALKALCEQAVEAVMPGRTTIIRPGLIVGPEDSSDRFTYWPARIAAGGEVLAPGDPTTPVQFIDVRDLAEFVLAAVEGGHAGVYNATGAPLPMGDLLGRSKVALASDAEFTWVSRQFLADNEVQPWSDLPVWLPPDPGNEGFATVKIDRARAIGLTARPLEDTVTETVAWWNTLPEPRRAAMRAGITRAREAELLAAWRASQAPAKPKAKRKAA